MPIPKPRAEEKKQEFISRVMSDPLMLKEYPDKKIRAGIAYSQWRQIHGDADRVNREVTFHLDSEKLDKSTLTPEGYLICHARPTRAGIFDYYDEKGNLFRELRSPEEVFRQESLDSLKMIPVTCFYDEKGELSHPSKMVTIDNVKELQTGITGENVSREGNYVACTIKLMDKSTIEKVRARRVAGLPVDLSCGYDANVINSQGEFETEGHYDGIQQNIHYNHVSIVDRGRAGSEAQLILDKKEGGKPLMPKFKRKGIKLDSFNMDEINVEIPDGAEGVVDRFSLKLDEAVEVIQTYDAQAKEAAKKFDEVKVEIQTKSDELKIVQKKADGAQAKLDQATEELTKIKIDVAELSNMDSARVQGMLAAKTLLEGTADKLKVDRKDKIPKQIKIDIIKAVSPEFKEDDKSDDYIIARYDGVIEMLADAEKNVNNSKLGEFLKDAHSNPGPVNHRDEFIKKSQDMWKGGNA